MIFVCPKIEKMTLAHNETQIFYQVKGEGPTLVLLHGFLEDSGIWTELVPALTATLRVVTIDLPGHGKSGHTSAISSMEYMADTVKAVTGHLGIGTFHLIGHSMGGYVCLAMLQLYPEKIKSLVLLNSTTVADSDQRKLNRDRALLLLDRNKERYLKATISSLFPEGSQGTYSETITTLKERALEFPVSGITAAIRGMRDRVDRTDVLRNFKGSKHFICGEDDPVVPLIDSKTVSLATHSELKILKGGHMSWVESRDELLDHLHFID